MREALALRIEGEDRTGTVVNLSEGGVAARVPAMAGLAPDTVVQLRFRLPHQPEPLDVRARAAWSVELKDGGGYEVGFRFEADQAQAHAALDAFLATFRYRVALVGVGEGSAVERALSEAYQPQRVDAPDQLAPLLDEGHLGLVVVAARLGPTALQRTLALTHGPPAVPVVLLAGAGPTSCDAVLRDEPRLICAREDDSAQRLRGLLFQCVEARALTVDNERLAVELASASAASQRERERALRALPKIGRLGGFIGSSEPMLRVYEAIERVARVDTSVFILGETGTGKGLVARAIHGASPRARRPFLVQNCAALAESLLDSELFGHTKGAFTGAVADRAGLFETASGGTVFLDEIGEMSPAMQAKLLNVLQDGEVRRVGSAFPTRVDVRVVCASHRNLAELVRDGRFREDLYYRLVSFVLQLPPLEARPADVRPLAEHFLAQFTARNRLPPLQLGPGALAALEQARWPGNVRQLQHCVERMALSHAGDGLLGRADAEAALAVGPASSSATTAGPRRLAHAIDERERELIEQALSSAGGVIADAARALGMERSTLSRRVKRLGLRAPR